MRSRKQKMICARCHVYSECDIHHWGPRSMFRDWAKWPVSPLCTAKCHPRWHRTMRANYQGKIFRLSVQKDDGDRASKNKMCTSDLTMEYLAGKKFGVGEVGILMLIDGNGDRHEKRGARMSARNHKFHFKGGGGYKKHGDPGYAIPPEDPCVFKDWLGTYVLVDTNQTYRRNQEVAS